MKAEIKDSVGNREILNNSKTAFLCSRQVTSDIILKCYDWAIEQREKGICVISGFHSKIEKDVLHYLLKGKQPIIVTLARGLKKNIEPEFKKPLEEGRMLIITPFEKEVKRVSEKTSIIRNQMMIDIADDVVVGYVKDKGNLQNILNSANKKIIFL